MSNEYISRRKALTFGCSALALPTAFRTPTAQTKPAPFIKGVTGDGLNRIAMLGEDFRSKFDLPGVSLAMSHRGKLKLLACFGYANKETNEAVRPQHQFRIASVSKPITSVAILRLMEQGKLKLDDRPFAKAGVLRKYFNATNDAKQRRRLEKITIRHLLEHTAGGWTNQGGEAPMFARDALGLSHPDLIRWTIKNMPLRTEPGEKYAYSNFGYCLLGRIIESVTRKPYEDAVKLLVLNRARAKATIVGKRTKEERQPNEVVYYDKYSPYGTNMDVARMDSHGGWISTPTDLVRFAQVVDRFKTPPDILKSVTTKQMKTPSKGSYALGWLVNKSDNWWHNGSFNGGTAILARIHDGHCWSVLVNTRPRQPGYMAALDQFPWKVKQAVKRWGDHDLFT